jgi:hypothetical protein
MNKESLARIEIVLGILINAIPGWFDQTNSLVIKWYFICQAISFSLFIHVAMLICKDRKVSIWLNYAFILSISNVLDELIGDPLHIHLNEIIIFIAATLYTIFLTKQIKNDKNEFSKFCNSSQQ